MPFLLLACILFAFIEDVRISILNNFLPFSKNLHLFCTQAMPEQILFKQEYLALTCGQNFLTAENSSLYSATGLIHLFVVSGAHLVLLDRLLRIIYIRSVAFRLILLSLYSFCCLLNPPIVRSLIVFFIAQAQTKFTFCKSSSNQVFITGLLALVLSPTWINSISLQLSWLISLAIVFNSQIWPGKGLLLHQFSFYFVVLPTISLFQTVSPYIILINLLLAPALELFLFPLSLLCMLVPYLSTVFDYSILTLRKILLLAEIPQASSSISVSTESILLFNWLLIFSIHLFLHLHQISKLRKTYE